MQRHRVWEHVPRAEIEGMPDRPEIVFTAENWQDAVTVTVNGVDDDIDDDDQTYFVDIGPSTSDAVQPEAMGFQA